MFVCVFVCESMGIFVFFVFMCVCFVYVSLCVYVCVVSLFAVKRNSNLIHLKSVVRKYQTVRNKGRKKSTLISLNYSIFHQ